MPVLPAGSRARTVPSETVTSSAPVAFSPRTAVRSRAVSRQPTAPSGTVPVRVGASSIRTWPETGAVPSRCIAAILAASEVNRPVSGLAGESVRRAVPE